MARAPIGKHGRDHRPGGHDPIPGLAGTGVDDSWPTQIVFDVLDFSGNSVFWDVHVDSTLLTNGYTANDTSGHTPASTDNFSMICPLGPQGSLWIPRIYYKTGPDCAQIDLRLASVPANSSRTGTDQDGSLIPEGSLSTWVPISQEEFPIDTYAASDGSDSQVGYAFRIVGAPGDPLTGLTSAGDSFTDADTLDGGPGIYRLRVQVTGKNASSSAFTAKVAGLSLHRVDDDWAP